MFSLFKGLTKGGNKEPPKDTPIAPQTTTNPPATNHNTPSNPQPATNPENGKAAPATTDPASKQGSSTGDKLATTAQVGTGVAGVGATAVQYKNGESGLKCVANGSPVPATQGPSGPTCPLGSTPAPKNGQPQTGVSQTPPMTYGTQQYPAGTQGTNPMQPTAGYGTQGAQQPGYGAPVVASQGVYGAQTNPAQPQSAVANQAAPQPGTAYQGQTTGQQNPYHPPVQPQSSPVQPSTTVQQQQPPPVQQPAPAQQYSPQQQASYASPSQPYTQNSPQQIAPQVSVNGKRHLHPRDVTYPSSQQTISTPPPQSPLHYIIPILISLSLLFFLLLGLWAWLSKRRRDKKQKQIREAPNCERVRMEDYEARGGRRGNVTPGPWTVGMEEEMHEVRF